MDYFQRFLNKAVQQQQQQPKQPADHAADFAKSWSRVRNTLSYPDERQLARGIRATDVPLHLKNMVDVLVWESTRTEEGGTGACLEYLLKNDVLGTLVRLSEADRPAGIQAEVLRAVQNMVVLLDEQFLVHSAVHRAVLRLLRNCVGDDIQEQLDGRNKVMGAAGNISRSQPSEYEEDLVNLLCILCSRIRTYRELLMIFFHDKHWYRSEPLFSLEEEEEDEEFDAQLAPPIRRDPSPTPSQTTVTSAQASSLTKKTEYEFLLFNYLLRFVHREGKTGDFARAGLLFLMDVAMSPGEPVHRIAGDPSSSSSEPNTVVSDPITDAALALAEYILDGDFSDVLGAGLSAVYSLLPSKLDVSTQISHVNGTGMAVGMTVDPDAEKQRLEEEFEKARSMGMEDAENPDFKSRLDHFLKILEFLQDVLKRNDTQESVDASSLVGSAIAQSILDAVRRIFLENVLYPHVLECSDADGSAVAVMAYIEVMIRTLKEGPLSDLLVDYLMSEDNSEKWPRKRQFSMLNLGDRAPPQSQAAVSDKETKSRRRQSSAMTLLEMEAPQSTKQTEYFTSMGRFTLKDLLMSNLRSPSRTTSTTALHLLQTMLVQQPQICIDRLLSVIPDSTATVFPYPPRLPDSEPRVVDVDDDDEDTFRYPGAEETVEDFPMGPVFLQPDTTYSTHEREVGLYLTLISRVDPTHNSEAFSTGYDHYLRDALVSIHQQPIFQSAIQGDPDASWPKHKLNVNDSVLSLVLESLRKFFSNAPEYNIALTGVLASLAIHPHRSLAGWLTFADDSGTKFEEKDKLSFPDEDGDDRSIDYKVEEKLATDSNILPASSADENSRPVVHTIFHGLVAQLERYREIVDNFDKYLLERRQGLLFSENLSDALSLGLDPTEEPLGQILPSPSGDLSSPTKRGRSSAASTLVSLITGTPKKNRTRPSTPPEPSTPSKSHIRGNSISASPFGPHYQQTTAITVEPFVPPVPKSSVWTPSKSVKWNADEEDVFSSGWGEKSEPKPSSGAGDDLSSVKVKNVTLSHLLDNVVILEESIKELVAIIQARRSLGIDGIRYV